LILHVAYIDFFLIENKKSYFECNWNIWDKERVYEKLWLDITILCTTKNGKNKEFKYIIA
jgi:hypothetical protein